MLYVGGCFTGQILQWEEYSLCINLNLGVIMAVKYPLAGTKNENKKLICGNL